MKKNKRIISIFVCVVYIALTLLFGAPAAVYAASAGPPSAFSGLRTTPADIVLNNARGRTNIAFTHDALNVSQLAPLYWDTANFDAQYTARIVKYYFDEHNKGYRGKQPARIFEDRRDRDFKPDGAYTANDLPSGMLYDVRATNYMEFEETTRPPAPIRRTVGYTDESGPSNQLLVFTGVQLDAQLISFDQVRIVWDDVWYNERRIYGYTLNIYTSGDTSNLQSSIPIYQNQIGPGRPVTVNEATGKLEYTYSVPYPGRVYSFEIVPLLGDVSGVIAPAKNGVVTVASRIAVVATKLFEDTVTDMITWDISWSNVTAGMGDDRVYTAVYTLSKMGGGASYQILQVISNYTSTILVTPRNPDDPENVGAVYEITAIVYADGKELYVGPDMVTITSGPFTLRESETPYTPQAPTLLLEEVESAQGPIKANLWWNIPKRVSEPDADDYEVLYEIFLLNDSKFIDMLSDPATANNITANFFEDGKTLPQGPSKTRFSNGYIYSIDNLAPNTTYYIAVRAVKTFIDIIDMAYISRYSQISYVVFTTPPASPYGQPPAPTTLELVKESVTTRSAVFNVRSIWYERLDKSTPEPWEWIWAPGYRPDGADLPDDYRRLAYEPGDQILLYYAEYNANMDLDNPLSLPAGTYVVAAITTVNEGNPIVRIPVSSLSPNKTYVFWARAARAGQPLSHPSKTILATTPPDPNTELVIPAAPDFETIYIGDTYVDLVWEKITDYYYSIQYSPVDAFTGANVTLIRTSTAEIFASGVDFYRVTGLRPDTMYYFRIRAETYAPQTNQLNVSAWSDSKPARTRPPMPPATPAGFGIKPGANSITKNSIFYEWLSVAGLTYILEYSRDATMTLGVGTVDAGAVEEYNLTGLLSNHRYYARLYAYDPITRLRSEPTYLVGATTRRSDDDYDANTDNTMPLTGEYVKIDAYSAEGVWHVKILGTDADRFVERILTDTYLDYSIDLTKAPRYTHTICITTEGKVIECLSKMLENLELVLPDKILVIRPYMLSPGLASSPAARRVVAYRYELLISVDGGPGYVKPGGLTLKTEPSGFDANVVDGGTRYPITGAFGKGLRVVVPFTGTAWYTSGVTLGFYSGPDGVWQRLKTDVSFNPDTRRGQIMFEYARPGTFFAADTGGRGLFNDVAGGGYSAYVNRLGALGYTDARAGSAFRPDDLATPAEAVGMVYRAMGYANDGTGSGKAMAGAAALNDAQYLASAYKAGFIADAWQTNIKIEEALALVARAYAVKAGVKVGARQAYAPGLDAAPEPVRTYAQYALDNGLAAPVVSGAAAFPAGRAATRAEVAVFICQALELLGE